MKWKIPPIIKIYEAIGCIADKRIEVHGNKAKVFSSSLEKYYTVEFDGKNKIMCNDNGSYYMGYLGYPAIAFLMMNGKITYNEKIAEWLKGIKWKDVNVRFRNDYKKTGNYIFGVVEKAGNDVGRLKEEAERVFKQVKELELELLGEKTKPPEGY